MVELLLKLCHYLCYKGSSVICTPGGYKEKKKSDVGLEDKSMMVTRIEASALHS